MDKIVLKVRLEGAKKNRKPHLDLFNLGLSELPLEIINFSWLKSIDIGSNKFDTIPEILTQLNLESIAINGNALSELPDYISEFKSLTSLNAKKNHLKSLPNNICKIGVLRKLILSENKLDALPKDFGKLKLLEHLNLSSNRFNFIYPALYALTNLQKLELDDNSIEEIEDGIEKLEHLVFFSIRGNRVQKITNKIGNLIDLFHLDISSNKIKDIPEEIFHLPKINSLYYSANPISSPPLEILTQGNQSIRNYFRELKESDSFLYEAKLLVLGEAGAGKTSLCIKIIDPQGKLPDPADTTMGIDIFKYSFEAKNKYNFVINIWDFGGQEIYHATHQFFLTKRSLYVLLSDNRAENTKFNYWLNVVELLSDNSPLIIVQNEKQGRKKDINERGIKLRFGNVLTTLQTDLSTGEGLKEIIETIEFNIQRLSHIGTKLPSSWIEIRKELEVITKSAPYISLDKYQEICFRHNLTTKTRCLHLSEYLHDIGAFLHYQDNPILKRWLILNPIWATDAVYKILDNPDVINNHGVFTKGAITRIWDVDHYAEMRDELLELMMRYELCYFLPEENIYIAPQLLPEEQPIYEWHYERNKTLVIKYVYKFLPQGIVTQLIVRLHRYLKDRETVWRSGAIFQWDESEAEVIETYAENEIIIRVKGENKKALFLLITESLERLTAKFSNIKYDKKIPCNCPKCHRSTNPHSFDYESIKNRLIRNRKEIECENSLQMISLMKLLGEYYESDSRIYKTMSENFELIPRIFISYAHEDKPYLLSLKKHLKILERTNKIKIWDDHGVNSGTEWNKEIMYNLEISDIVILLISSDFISSDFCYEIEMIRALERHEKKDAMVIPIIVRSCMWFETPFSKLQAIVPDGGAVDKKVSDDRIWTKIASQLKDDIANWRSNQLIQV